MNKIIIVSTLPRSRGFTLIELLTVIVILGTLSVVAVSRFQGKDGFAEFGWQKRLISALRNVQQLAMQDTRALDGAGAPLCHQLVFDTANVRFGVPTDADSCSTTINIAGPSFLSSGSGLVDDNVQLAAVDNSLGIINLIGFNGLGQPVDSTGDRICTTGCQISFSNSAVAKVCIESEGYIRACL
ncbi:type II secretion system protein [Alteromonadaceae bacterium BrNp21-10]|nr:type II secretion system protein [Alteromonadaceae bacterium BrNp21-10]